MKCLQCDEPRTLTFTSTDRHFDGRIIKTHVYTCTSGHMYEIKELYDEEEE